MTQKLDLSDMQMEKGTFDGTMSYASQKRQQVCVTEEWAKLYPDIHFSTTHPGWADTPAVRSSMPDFYEKMKDKLRTSEQGADCITWLGTFSNSGLVFDWSKIGRCFENSKSGMRGFRNWSKRRILSRQGISSKTFTVGMVKRIPSR